MICLGLLLPALTAIPVLALDDSTVAATVIDSKFHVEINLQIELPIDDLTQFTDAKDAYSRETGVFKGMLRESIESGVKALVPGASVVGLKIEELGLDESEEEMHVTLSFDVEGAITGTDGREYDLRWRSFVVDRKFMCADRRVDPSEALGLDFRPFDDKLGEWTASESEGNTVIRRMKEYELDTDYGDVDLRVTMRFTLPGTGLKVGDDKVTLSGTTPTTGSQPPGISGFPWEAVAVGVVLAVAVAVRRRRQSEHLPPVH